MKALKFLKNSAGVSMVEVMMAVAVVGGLSLTVAQLMKNTSENTKQNEAKQENVSLKALIQNNLGVPTACFNTFDALITQANLTAMTGTGTVAVPNIKDKVNAIKYSSATNLKPLTITSMVLTNYIASAGTADLVVNSTFKKSTNNIVMVKPLKIPINFNINTTIPATPDLISCSSMAVSGGEWMLAGNAGTVDGTDYLGTSDSSPLNFRVNAIPSGRIDMSGATFFGYRSGMNNVAGTVNTSFGYDALSSASSTGDNTAVGSSALKTNAQWGNTAVGHEALMVNSTGGNNTAIGRNAQVQSTTGTYNTCVGALCMNNLTTGTYNVGVGVTALWGHNSGKLQGSNNIGIGYAAGQFMSTGAFNVLVGDSAGKNMTNGTRNVVIGAESGQGLTTESFKLHVESSGNATPLIGGDFSARTVSIDGKLGIGMLNPLGVNSSVVTIGTPPAEASTHKVRIYFPFTTSGTTALSATTTHGSGWVYAMQAFVGGTPAGSKSVALLASSSAAAASTVGRSFGVWAKAGNSTTGHNYALVGSLEGTNGGTALYAAGDGSEPIDMNAYNGGVAKKWAGIFVGDTYHTGNSSAVLHTNRSDVRLKKNIKTLDRSLDKVLRLRGVRYEWKEDKGNLGAQVGLIAQEVEKEFPEVVQGRDNNKKMREVNYSGLVAPLIESIKEIYNKILALISSDEKQNIELEKLKAENEKLKADLRSQSEQFNQRMKKIESEISKKK